MRDEGNEWDEDGPDYRLEKGDQLFTNDEVRTHFDKINNYGYTDYKRKSFFVLAQEFKEAADRVVESLENFILALTTILPLQLSTYIDIIWSCI